MCLAGTLTHNRCPQRAQQQQVIGLLAVVKPFWLLDTCELTLHSGPENFTKAKPKKLVKSKRSISRKPFCEYFPKKLKLSESMENIKKQLIKLILFISRVFWPRLFKNSWPTVALS